MHRNRLLTALVVAALLSTACGDDDSPDTNEYSEALAESLAEDEDVPFERRQTDCLASEFVDAVGGPEALEDAGITPEELRESDDIAALGLDPDAVDTDAVADSFSNCDISLSELVLADAGDEVPDEVRACVSDALDEDALADFFAQSIIAGDGTGDEDVPLPPEIMEPLLECL